MDIEEKPARERDSRMNLKHSQRKSGNDNSFSTKCMHNQLLSGMNGKQSKIVTVCEWAAHKLVVLRDLYE